MMDTAHRRAEPAHIPASAADTHPAPTQNPHDAGDVAGVSDVLTGPTSPEPGSHPEGLQLALDYDVIGPGSDELSEWLNGQAWSAINFHAGPVLNAVDAGDFTPETPAALWERVRPEDGDLAAMADTIASKARRSGQASPHGNIGGAALDKLREVRRCMDNSPGKRPTPARRRKHRTQKARRSAAKSHAARRLARTDAEASLMTNADAGLSDAANLVNLQAKYGESCPWTTRAGVGATRRRLQDTPEALITPAPESVTTELSPAPTCPGTTVRGRSCGRRVRPGAQGCRYHPDATPQTPFPAPEIPPDERWPVTQFTNATGIQLDAWDAVWLAAWGRCYEADGCASTLTAAIQASAGAAIDPWSYLTRCVANGYDAWTVTPQLVADVLTWAGQQSLEYALTAIGGGYVERPLPYLRRVLAKAVAQGKRSERRSERPVAMAVQLARRWAPELHIDDADAAIAAEDAASRTGYIDEVRALYGGHLPWETVDGPVPGPAASVGDNVAIPVNPGDDTKLLENLELTSSRPGSPDSNVVTAHGITVASAAPEGRPPVEAPVAPEWAEKSEHAANWPIRPDLAGIGGDPPPVEAPRTAQRTHSAFGGAGGEPVFRTWSGWRRSGPPCSGLNPTPAHWTPPSSSTSSWTTAAGVASDNRRWTVTVGRSIG